MGHFFRDLEFILNYYLLGNARDDRFSFREGSILEPGASVAILVRIRDCVKIWDERRKDNRAGWIISHRTVVKTNEKRDIRPT